MNRLLILVLFLGYVHGLHAQQGNPFDIRQVETITVDTLGMAEPTETNEIKPESTNPFDLNYNSKPQKAASSNEVEAPSIVITTPQPASQGPSDLITLLYSILMLVALTLGINLNRKRFMTIMRSFINSNHLKNLYKDHRAWTELQSFILYGLFFANVAFLLGLLNGRFWDNHLPSLPLLLIAVILVYLIRHFVMWVISYVYGMDVQVGLHNYSIGLHNIITGVLLVPFILSFGFLPEGQGKILLYALLALLTIVYLSRQAKGLLSAMNMRGFNLFYFFIYLCAIEIAPFLVAWKIVSRAL